jgi:hypothetical protein
MGGVGKLLRFNLMVHTLNPSAVRTHTGMTLFNTEERGFWKEGKRKIANPSNGHI